MEHEDARGARELPCDAAEGQLVGGGREGQSLCPGFAAGACCRARPSSAAGCFLLGALLTLAFEFLCLQTSPGEHDERKRPQRREFGFEVKLCQSFWWFELEKQGLLLQGKDRVLWLVARTVPCNPRLHPLKVVLK